MEKVIECELSAKSFRDAAKEVRKYKEDFLKQVDLFVQRLAEEGVKIAQLKVPEDTTALRNSIGLKPGEVIKNGSQWMVFTDCPWAAFVEFGFGVGVKHPDPQDWGYDLNQHGTDGWWFIADEHIQSIWNPRHLRTRKEDGMVFAWTSGSDATAFMFHTARELSEASAITRIAKEVFGG